MAGRKKTVENSQKDAKKHYVNMDIASIFRNILYEQNSATKIIYLAITLMFFILILPIGLFLGYVYNYIKNIFDNKKKLLPDWNDDFNNLSKMYVNGWKLFLIILPILVINFLFGLFFKTVFFFLPIIVIVISLIILPFIIMDFIYTGNFSALWNVNGFFEYLKKEFINIIIGIIYSIGLLIIASFGIIGLVFVFYSFSWAILVLSQFWANIYLDYKRR